MNAFPVLERKPAPTLDLWHRRLGHLGVRNVKATKLITTGIEYEPTLAEPSSTLCEACELSKPLRHVRKTISPKDYTPFDSVSVDVVMINPRGKILLNDSWINVRYCTVFTDAASSTRCGHYHYQKNGAIAVVENLNAMASTQFGTVAKSWRLNGGKGFSPSRMGAIASRLGQIVEMTTPYTPQQDGRAECSIGIIVSRGTSTLRGETPFQFLNRTYLRRNDLPDLSNLRVLGCKTYVQIPVERRVISRKLNDRAEIGMLVGYEGQHIFCVYIPSRRKVIQFSNVRFDKKCSVNIPQLQDDHWESFAHPHFDLAFPIDGSREEKRGTSNNSQFQEPQLISELLEIAPFEKLVGIEGSRNCQEAEEIRHLLQAQRPRGRLPGSKNRPKVPIEPSTCVLRSNYNRNVNEDAAFAAFIAATNSSEIDRNEDDPKTMVEAVSGKIVLKTKMDKNGEILKYKVRWAIRGFEQRVGHDFTQTYAGVCRITSWKVALSIAAMFDLEIEQLDAVTASLNSTADRDDIYAEFLL
ncbi:hypothetical protein K3495_g2310 [Podosphaera aphanis]|nr:hypothetical protein K3495_g2310 [Podosphaera aphanis]